MPQTLSRRALLAAAAAGGSTLLVSGCAEGPAPESGPESHPVVVIGAGAAGLAAARSLVGAGQRVRVIEARDRIGGRVHTTTQWPDLPVDIGASWIHGARGNPVTELAREAGVETVATSYASSLEVVSPAASAAGVAALQGERWERLLEEAIVWAADQEADISVADAVAGYLARSGVRLSEAEDLDLAFFLDGAVSTEWGARPEQVSAWMLEEGEDFDGEDLLILPGYARVLEHLATDLEIQLSSPVSAVRMGQGLVEVVTATETLTATAVIVTVPLGVLKSGVLTVEPEMSAPARAGIDRIGVGVLSKTFLRFDEVAWPDDVDWIGHVGSEPGRWGQWLSLAPHGLPVLLAFNAGEFGALVEAMSESEVIHEAHAALRRMFGPTIPRPVQALTSTWSSDPWALGSYSYNAVGATRADREALAAPIEGRIFWAGEATEPDYHSTVHGAVLSGRRAAEEVLAALGRG